MKQDREMTEEYEQKCREEYADGGGSLEELEEAVRVLLREIDRLRAEVDELDGRIGGWLP